MLIVILIKPFIAMFSSTCDPSSYLTKGVQLVTCLLSMLQQS